MWMTTGMAPMMFPGAHQLMPPMAMGLNPGCMPAAQSLSQLQRVAPFMNNPLPNQVPQVQSPATNSLNVTNQMQNNGICAPRNPFLVPNDTIATSAQVIGTHFLSLDLSDFCSWWLMVSVRVGAGYVRL
jgi:phytochrome-interacting factor 4